VNEDWIATGNASTFVTSKAKGLLDMPVDGLYSAFKEGRFERLETQACVEAYLQPFQSKRSELLLVADGNENGVFGHMEDPPSTSVILDHFDDCGSHQSFQWMCKQYQMKGVRCPKLCEELFGPLRADAAITNWKPYSNKTVNYCYSMPSEEHCKLKFSTTLLFIVVGLNLFKALLMFTCAFTWKTDVPMLTVGDAVASFLERPDETTANMCLLTRDDIWQMGYWKQPGGVFENQRRRRYMAASSVKWVLTLLW
jgi:hypothetical protein